MIKNILFDFDGVLVESVSIKAKAFEKMYLPYGVEMARRVVNHHLFRGGGGGDGHFWENTVGQGVGKG